SHAVEAAAEHDQEPDGGGSPQRREEAAGVEHTVVAPEPRLEDRQRRRDQLRDVEGKRAVREEVGGELERVERDLERRVGDRALVRMEEMTLIEVDAEDSYGGGEDDDEEQRAAPREWRR